MKRIIIIGEGQTEQQFCNDVLQSHFNSKDIYLQNATIKKTGGGIVNWQALKHQIETHLRQDKSAYVTTFIDLYGIHDSHEFPQWEEAKKEGDKYKSMEILLNAMQGDIDQDLTDRFIPYIQLHEFEGLLFSEIKVFEDFFEDAEFSDFEYLKQTTSEHANPEFINNSRITAPSKRLKRILASYDKITYGSLIAQEIGLNKIREKCPGFNKWIDKLESL